MIVGIEKKTSFVFFIVIVIWVDLTLICEKPVEHQFQKCQQSVLGKHEPIHLQLRPSEVCNKSINHDARRNASKCTSDRAKQPIPGVDVGELFGWSEMGYYRLLNGLEGTRLISRRANYTDDGCYQQHYKVVGKYKNYAADHHEKRTKEEHKAPSKLVGVQCQKVANDYISKQSQGHKVPETNVGHVYFTEKLHQNQSTLTVGDHPQHFLRNEDLDVT